MSQKNSVKSCRFCGEKNLLWGKVDGKAVLMYGAVPHVCKPAKCDRCRGSGVYGWGAVVNGKISHSGPCFRCHGTGTQDARDMRRNNAYDRHAIARAFGGG